MTDLNQTEFAGRPKYKPSGRVNWGRWLPLFLGGLALSIVMGLILQWIDSVGFYFILFGAIIISLPVCFYIKHAMVWAQCRNTLVGGFSGLACGFLIYLTYFHAGMVSAGGPEFLYRLDYLPYYIHQKELHRTLRFKSSSIQSVWVNYGTTLLDVGIALAMCGAAGVTLIGNAYSESEERWASREILYFPAGSSAAICNALLNNATPGPEFPQRILQPGDVPATFVIMEFPSKHSQMGHGLGQDDNVYVTVGEIEKASTPLPGVQSGPMEQVLFNGWEIKQVLGNQLGTASA